MRALGAAVLLFVSACAGQNPADSGTEEIAIGLIAPFGDQLLRSGPATLQGASLAVEEINAHGGIELDGERRLLRLVVESSDGQPEVAVSKAFKLIDSDGVVALVGMPFSDSALAVAKVAEERRVPMITTVSTHPETTRGKSYVFRAIFDDEFQSRLLAEFAYRDLEARRAAIVFDPGSSFSSSLARQFRKSFELLGGEVSAEVSYSVDGDASEGLLRIRETGADVLVMPVYTALLEPLMRQARSLGLSAPALGTETWGNLSPETRRGWSPAFFSDVWAPGTPTRTSGRFLTAYEEAYGTSPASYAALAYDAVLLIARALETGGATTPEKVRDGLRSLEGFTGATGSIRFPDGGDPARSAAILKLGEDGTARLYRRIEP